MTEIDGALLEPLAIKAIFDLRTPPERQSFPTAWQCALQPEIHTIDVHAEGDDPKADLFQLILDGRISQDDVRSHMLADYALMPYQFAPMLKKICQHFTGDSRWRHRDALYGWQGPHRAGGWSSVSFAGCARKKYP